MTWPYTIAWFVLLVVAILNGVIRNHTYGKAVSELTAHQISTVSAIILSGLIVLLFHRIWPIGSSGQAWIIGCVWLSMTIIFEFVFGHFVVGHSWGTLFADYNLLNGRVWILFLLWMLLVPNVVYRFA